MDYRARASMVHAARALYALNWMDMAPALVYIKADMDLTVVELGMLVTAFYLGIAIFQVLGGYLSSVIGDKTTSLIGLLFVSIFAITSGLSINFSELIVSRFLAGLSAALFFSPALSLLASIVPEGKYTFHIGIYNGAFNVGAGIGVIGWAILDLYFGYRLPFIIAGIVTMALFFVLVLLFKDIKNVKTERADIFRSFKKVFTSKLIILIAFIGIGSMVAETIIGQFLVYYLESINYTSTLAGSISSLYLVIGFFGGIIGGYHFSHTVHKIGTFLAINIAVSVSLIFIPFLHSIIFLVIFAIAVGMMTVYGFSITYTFIRYLSRRDLVSLTLSFANTVQLLVAVAVPVIFTLLVSDYNYTVAWIALGIIGLVFIPLIFAVKDNIKRAIPS
ncbi:MAG: MFS transporter [Ferroplasma sp.]